MLGDCWSASGAALGGVTIGSSAGPTLRFGSRWSTLAVCGGSTLGGVVGSTLGTGGGYTLRTGDRYTLGTDGGATVGGVKIWAVKMLVRCRRAVAWLLDGGRTGPDRSR